jgi:hypothetical protein
MLLYSKEAGIQMGNLNRKSQKPWSVWIKSAIILLSATIDNIEDVTQRMQ